MGALFRRVVREPLVWFFVAGAALFAIHRRVRGDDPRHIVVSAAYVAGLREEFTQRHARPPSAAEEQGLVEHFIDEEVLYREALSLGLDRGDLIVRRRLVQKMEFLARDDAEPAAGALEAWFASHRDHYRTAPRLSFQHVYIDPSHHANAAELASSLLASVRAGGEPATLGDPFIAGARFTQATEGEIATRFGPAFAASLFTLPVGEWAGPVASGLGLHLVRVGERTEGAEADFASVAPTVRRDWEEERRAEGGRAALAGLRRRYRISVAGADR